ncbi:hypothetical protein MSAN_01512600 [Mycena sanguinolenta]|uniref:Uncharacterized protein n=1 Tax=Mycena sanguinolenta TaxID=230812 RepID=A0A8H7CZL5_9AGAR|nr:hypothetical protein MSAN_01512600 [Mycena sanguinolenta]
MFIESSQVASEALVERAITRAVKGVPGMDLLYISADPRPGNHPGKQTDFRTIRRGDLKLLKEVRLSTESGVVSRQSRGVDVRRIHHAEIRGDPGIVTVAVYQGDGAEEEWRKHIATYESIWDPRIMQLHGLVSGNGLYAMVFHDELIPYAQFLRRFKHSPVLSTYISGYCSTQFWEATHFISRVSRKPLPVTHSASLCVLLALTSIHRTVSTCQDGYNPEQASSVSTSLKNVTLDAPDSEDMIISSLSQDQYHELCCQPSIAQRHWFQVSTEHPIGPGIFQPDSQYGTCVRIMEPLQILPEEELHWENYGRAPDELLPNLWIRYDSHRTNALLLELRLRFWERGIPKAWLAQANCIFAELEEGAHIEDYICIGYLQLNLQIANKHYIPKGYLFVCPPRDLCTSNEAHANLYQWPACPAYWSLDPSGADRLSTEDAKSLGFPAIHIETGMYGYSWDHSVYEGLRRFHEGKGFDPDSREVARRLRYPLYEVLSDCTPFPAREVNNEPYSWRCKQDDPALCRSLSHNL